MNQEINVIDVFFKLFTTTKTKTVYQYNSGMVLKFNDLELPNTFQVDFSNDEIGQSVSKLGSNNEVVIPEQFFVPGSTIHAWIVLTGEDYRVTTYHVVIPISVRATPTNIQPTPDQRTIIDDAIYALNTAVETTGHDVELTHADVETTVENARAAANDAADALAYKNAAELAESNAQRNAQTATEQAGFARNSAQQAANSAQTAINKADAAAADAAIARSAQTKAETAASHYPVIRNNIWYVWSVDYAQFISTGIVAEGEDGYSPTVAVSSITGGHRVTITDKSEPHIYDVMDGQTGATPEFSIGTVTTGDAGTSASATITGTAEAPVLSLTIPKGDTGDTGATGADGTTFTPAVSSAGVISWTNDGGKSNPPDVDLAGVASDKAVKEEQEVVNALHNLVNYGYDTPFEQEENPSASGYQNRVGVVRKGNILTLNKSTTTSTTIRMRISGDVAFAGNASGVAAWGNGLLLIDGHKYKITVRLLSGTSNYDSNTSNVVPYCYVYETGASTNVATKARQKDGMSITKFTAYAGKTYVLALIFNSGKFTIANAKMLVVLEDLDETMYTERTDSVAMPNIGDAVRDTVSLTDSGSTGGYIELNKSIGTTIPETVKLDADYGHLETACHAGDAFWLTCTTSGDDYRAWAFLDSNRVLLRVAAAGVTADNLKLTAYEDGYFVCNYAVASVFNLSAKKLFKAAKFPTAPTENGTYALTVTVTDGVLTYAWVAQT